MEVDRRCAVRALLVPMSEGEDVEKEEYVARKGARLVRRSVSVSLTKSAAVVVAPMEVLD